MDTRTQLASMTGHQTTKLKKNSKLKSIDSRYENGFIEAMPISIPRLREAGPSLKKLSCYYTLKGFALRNFSGGY